MKKWLSVCAATSLILLTSTLKANYTDADLANSTATAKAWLSLIDNGDFEASYSQSSEDFQKKVSHDKWVTIMKSLRVPLGKLTNRKPLTHDYLENGLDGDKGEHMIFRYISTFSDGSSDQLETVTLKRFGDHWLPSGYGFQAKPDNAN